MSGPVNAGEETEAYLNTRCPSGWTREFVDPPWKGQSARCRSCGRVHDMSSTDTRWAVTTMVRLDDTRKVMRFSFAMVCEECIKDEQRMKSIADRVFVETKPIDVALASEGRAHAVCEECSKLVSRQVFTTMTITDTECEACGTAIKKFDAVSVSPNQWAEIQATHAKNYYAVCVGCADLLSGEPFNCVSISDTRCDACGSTIVPWNATQVDLGQWNRIQTKRRSKVKQVE